MSSKIRRSLAGLAAVSLVLTTAITGGLASVSAADITIPNGAFETDYWEDAGAEIRAGLDLLFSWSS